ncbi:TPA: o-succinylbenzoate--CoA ligase [Providencia stuartii]|uniref:o-succinylbenzoate--CoA ligase n=1 Tax=Providencia stuartii TaxID=588 RepID=UPI0009773EA2|nr:o-succinylbenzoate--CoA ligase [Providencia stuartii]OMH53181.1 o-succinylbenzoate--CoA ligase [Providencia stuartii]HEM8864258.1 o-succinylbenzoate--CoA ligase [Providencia stuartii]
MAELVFFQDWPWQHWASHRPEAVALITDIEPLTWEQLNQRVMRLAYHFTQQGLRDGQTVVLRGKNSVELLLSQLATLYCGAKVLPLNPRLPESLLAELLPHLNIDFAIDFDDGLLAKFTYPILAVSERAVTAHEWEHHLPHFSHAKTQPATLILTSGSTGLPKAAVHNVLAHLDSANGVLQAMDYQQHDCWLLSLPLFHVSGQGILWRWLLCGAQLAIRSTPLIEALQTVTHASLVPTQLWRLLNQTETLSLSLKQVLLGGATIPTALTDLASHRGIDCWSGYGMTEMASTVCAKRADGKKGVGLPLKGKQLRLVEGEIQVRSQSQAMGYWFDGKMMPLKTIEGWFKTNDRGAYIDDEYHVIGRLDNLFISGGECVQPEDIEAVINNHPAVSQSFIIPIDDVEFGQRPVAVIEFSDKCELDTIQGWLKGKLAPFQYPAHFFLLENSLKGSGIKVSRQQVKNWVLQQPDLIQSKENSGL